MPVCPQCKREVLSARAKFCEECGSVIPRESPVVALQDDAMVAGDIIGTVQETKVAGDYHVTHVQNLDETKKVHVCAISGEHVVFSNLRACPSCGLRVSASVFDQENFRCFRCRDKVEAQLRQQIKDLCTQPPDSAIDTKVELANLRQKLSISAERFEEIEADVRQDLPSPRLPEKQESVCLPQSVSVKVQVAAKAITSEPWAAIDVLRPHWTQFKKNDDFKSVYLGLLAICRPREVDIALGQQGPADPLEHFFYAQAVAKLGNARDAIDYLSSRMATDTTLSKNTMLRLLSAELMLDDAITTESEFAKEAQIKAAAAELESCLQDGRLQAAYAGFICDYVDFAKNANGEEDDICEWLNDIVGKYDDSFSSQIFLDAALRVSIASKMERFHGVWRFLEERELGDLSPFFKECGRPASEIHEFLSNYRFWGWGTGISTEEVLRELHDHGFGNCSNLDFVATKIAESSKKMYLEEERRRKNEAENLKWKIYAAGWAVMIGAGMLHELTGWTFLNLVAIGGFMTVVTNFLHSKKLF